MKIQFPTTKRGELIRALLVQFFTVFSYYTCFACGKCFFFKKSNPGGRVKKKLLGIGTELCIVDVLCCNNITRHTAEKSASLSWPKMASFDFPAKPVIKTRLKFDSCNEPEISYLICMTHNLMQWCSTLGYFFGRWRYLYKAAMQILMTSSRVSLIQEICF